ncbi:MAG: glutamine-hydrolyzing GMP synthase [Deltaproteobacteria bacterium]|nr:glutamine-hydrolyzing GMP synthase [Deltaproteobacteria bacterium]
MNKILILDFGSQYTQLIARRIRENGVYSEIHPFNISLEKIKNFNAKAIILSGGPSSVYAADAPQMPAGFFDLKIPMLGICYGMQLMGKTLGGKVEAGLTREYGRARIEILKEGLLFSDRVDEGRMKVWMSHGDHVTQVPAGFEILAKSDNGLVAAMGSVASQHYAVQFHPEVTHTERGEQILKNFLFKIAGCKPDWNLEDFAQGEIERIRKQVGSAKVICATSGGVDSTVAAHLVHKAIGDQLTCIFINNGVLRKNEGEKVQKLFREHLHIPLQYIDASERFLKVLSGVEDPETKRKRIGNEFIYIFEEEAKKVRGSQFLVQGTLYPDVIESVSFKGPSAVIKSHHNVGGLPDKMGLQLIEPLRELFKDEVRVMGRKMGIPEELISRQPFPGPGLAIRILGDVTFERLEILRNADEIVVSEIRAAGWYTQVWQSFAVLLPIKTVGVMGDERTYENVIALRCVSSSDGMTADWVDLPTDLLSRISNRIINEVKGVNRVVYDISSKPPATIEWE